MSWIVIGMRWWCGNANLILIWPHCYFQQKDEGAVFLKIPMLTPYKCVFGIPSSNLFLVQALVPEVLKNVLPIYYHQFCL